MSQAWEKLLFCSGGALELSKCFYYLLHWKWSDGLPQLLTKNEILELIPPICLTSGLSLEQVAIAQKDVQEAHKTSGVFLAPSGQETAQIQYLQLLSNRIAALVLSSNLSKAESLLSYKTSWFPSVGYSLGVTAIEELPLKTIQSMATCSFLAKIGINRHFPRPVVFGPLEYSGFRPPRIRRLMFP
jgi:hypothetical protein